MRILRVFCLLLLLSLTATAQPPPATETITRMNPGRAHGTRLFDARYDSVSRLIMAWLEELFASDE